MKSYIHTLLLVFLLPLASIAQTVTLTPDNAYEGETLTITAVSSSPLFSAFPGSYVEFSFLSQAGSWNSIYPQQNPTLSGSNTATANFVIAGSSTGWYNLYLGAGNYYIFNAAFFVNQNLLGPGTIGGTINQGTPKVGYGDPVDGLRLYLINNNSDTIAITRTKADGTFKFLYLPYGTYFLHAQGANNSNPLQYVVEPNNSNLSNVFITYDGSANRLVYIKEINLFVENALAFLPSVFNESFALTYTLAKTSNVSIQVYDMKGALVTTLVDKDSTPAGTYNHRFDAADANILTAGVYIVKVNIGEGTASVKIVKQ